MILNLYVIKKEYEKKTKDSIKQYKKLKSKEKEYYQSNEDNIIIKINTKIILVTKIITK